MSYEESELLSLLTKQEIDTLFLRANSYLCQVKFLLEEKEQLQKENEQLKNNINKLQKELNEENFQCSKYAIEINDLKENNKQLKDNWNKLKEYIKKEGFEINTREYGSLDVIDKYAIIEKIQELEKSDNNE